MKFCTVGPELTDIVTVHATQPVQPLRPVLVARAPQASSTQPSSSANMLLNRIRQTRAEAQAQAKARAKQIVESRSTVASGSQEPSDPVVASRDESPVEFIERLMAADLPTAKSPSKSPMRQTISPAVKLDVTTTQEPVSEPSLDAPQTSTSQAEDVVMDDVAQQATVSLTLILRFSVSSIILFQQHTAVPEPTPVTAPQDAPSSSALPTAVTSHAPSASTSPPFATSSEPGPELGTSNVTDDEDTGSLMLDYPEDDAEFISEGVRPSLRDMRV